MNNAVGWFEIYVQDMTRARAFYEAVFKRKLEKLGSPEIEMWSFSGDMNTYGAPGALVKLSGLPSGGNSTLVYFSCQDCAVKSKRASEEGGTVCKAKFSIGEYGFIALVNDTEGNMIGLHSLQ